MRIRRTMADPSPVGQVGLNHQAHAHPPTLTPDASPFLLNFHSNDYMAGERSDSFSGGQEYAQQHPVLGGVVEMQPEVHYPRQTPA